MTTTTARQPQLGDRLADIPVNTIHPDPNQPRSVITDRDIADMADSIKALGLQERVMLRMRPEGGYWLVAGETRWRAFMALERLTIPAVVRLDLNDDAKAFEAAFISNFGRKDMDPIDEAEGLRRIFHAAGCGSNIQLARRVNRTLSYVTDRLLLNWLDDDDKQAVRDGRMPLGEAVAKAREISGRKGTPRMPAAAPVSARPRQRPPAPVLPSRGFGRDPWGTPVSLTGGSHAAAPKPAVAAPPPPLPAPPAPAFSASPEPAPRPAPTPSPAPSRGSEGERLRELLLRAVRAGRAADGSLSDDAIVDEILAGELARS